MKRYVRYMLLSLAAVVGLTATAVAQRMPERSLVRKGNRQFARERYDLSADSYKQALESAPGNFEATYNLGNTMVRTEQYDKAEQLLTAAAADSLRSDEERAEAFYNLGNAQFAQKKLKEALASYRHSLELNPADMEAKYNYAYTKRLLDDQQNQDQNKDQNQNQDQDQNQDQNQNQNQNGDGQNDRNKDQNDQNQDQNGDGQNDQNQDDQNNPDGQNDGGDDGKDQNDNGRSRSGMSRQQQEQLLDAIQAQEDKTQDKIDEKKKGVIVKGRKNW